MNAHIAVHQLCDVNIDGNAGQHIGFIAAEMLFFHQKIDLEYVHFQDVARFGLSNIDWPREDMPARSLILDLAIDGGVIGRNILRSNTLADQALR